MLCLLSPFFIKEVVDSYALSSLHKYSFFVFPFQGNRNFLPQIAYPKKNAQHPPVVVGADDATPFQAYQATER